MKTVYDLMQGEKVVEVEENKSANLTSKALRILVNAYQNVLPIVLQEVAEFEVFKGLNPKIMLTGENGTTQGKVEKREDGFYRVHGWGGYSILSPSQTEQAQLPFLIPRPEKYNPTFLELLSKFYLNEDNTRGYFIYEINNRIWTRLRALQEFYGDELFVEIEKQFMKITNEVNEREPRVTICKNLSIKIEFNTPKKTRWILIKC